MQNEIIEKKAYPLAISIIYLSCMIGLAVVFIIAFMMANNIYIRIFILLISFYIIYIWYLVIRYKPFSAIVTLDKSGVHYKSKETDNFLPWERIHRVFVYGPGELETVIFIDSSVNRYKYTNNQWKTSNSQMFIYKYRGVLEYVEQNWRGHIDNIEYYKKKSERKKTKIRKW